MRYTKIYIYIYQYYTKYQDIPRYGGVLKWVVPLNHHPGGSSDFPAIFNHLKRAWGTSISGNTYPIGSMCAIYGNIYHPYTPFMLAYIPAPWILWVYAKFI